MRVRGSSKYEGMGGGRPGWSWEAVSHVRVDRVVDGGGDTHRIGGRRGGVNLPLPGTASSAWVCVCGCVCVRAGGCSLACSLCLPPSISAPPSPLPPTASLASRNMLFVCGGAVGLCACACVRARVRARACACVRVRVCMGDAMTEEGRKGGREGGRAGGREEGREGGREGGKGGRWEGRERNKEGASERASARERQRASESVRASGGERVAECEMAGGRVSVCLPLYRSVYRPFGSSICMAVCQCVSFCACRMPACLTSTPPACTYAGA